jgi:hypothetical protein
VLQIDDHAIAAGTLHGQAHLLAELLGNLFALNARLRDGQDQDALIHGSMQKWAGGREHAALEGKGQQRVD